MHFTYIHNMNEKIEIRKVQANDKGRSIQIVLPRIFAESLKLHGGDYIKISLDQGKLIFQKADL